MYFNLCFLWNIFFWSLNFLFLHHFLININWFVLKFKLIFVMIVVIIQFLHHLHQVELNIKFLLTDFYEFFKLGIRANTKDKLQFITETYLKFFVYPLKCVTFNLKHSIRSFNDESYIRQIWKNENRNYLKDLLNPTNITKDIPETHGCSTDLVLLCVKCKKFFVNWAIIVQLWNDEWVLLIESVNLWLSKSKLKPTHYFTELD